MSHIAPLGLIGASPIRGTSGPMKRQGHHVTDRWPSGDAAAVYFGGFAVLPGFWGGGLGTRIVDDALERARAYGHPWFRFDAVSSNEVLVRWYRSLGFTVTGHIPVGDLEVTCFERSLP